MSDFSVLVLPLLIVIIIGYGFFQSTPVFECFLSGGAEGMQTLVKILPTMVGFLTAVTMFTASGGMDLLTTALTPLADLLGLPGEVVPLALIHPISGSGATAVLTDIYARYGTDSIVGQIASTICGSGETTFYAVTVYYGSVKVKNIRHTLWVALLADFTAAVLSGVGVALFM